MISSGGEADAKGGADVHRKLLLTAERDEGRQRDAAACAPVEAVPRPDLTPGIARDQVLEVLGERRRPRIGVVDMLVSQHFAARAHAAFERVAHSCPSR